VAGIAIATAADLERALRLDAGAFAEAGQCRCWSGSPWHLRSVNLHAGARLTAGFHCALCLDAGAMTVVGDGMTEALEKYEPVASAKMKDARSTGRSSWLNFLRKKFARHVATPCHAAQLPVYLKII